MWHHCVEWSSRENLHKYTFYRNQVRMTQEMLKYCPEGFQTDWEELRGLYSVHQGTGVSQSLLQQEEEEEERCRGRRGGSCA